MLIYTKVGLVWNLEEVRISLAR